MKKILFGLLCMSSFSLFAQDNRENSNHQNRGNVPAPVQRSFQKDYPNVQNPQWNNSNGQWHGTYKDQNNRNVQSNYNTRGQRIDTHVEYDNKELPDNVRNTANKRYSSSYKTYRIERPNSQPLFQIKTQNGHTVYMDENGRQRKYNDRH